MTEENDISTEDADSGRSTDEKLDANVIAKSGPAHDPDVYLVEYPDGSQEYEPATPTNVALFEDGLYGKVQGHTEYTVSVGPDTITVALDADIENRNFLLTVDGSELPVPTDRAAEVVKSFKDANGSAIGSRLYSMYEDILEGQVRRHIVEAFTERFPADRVAQTPDGWIVDDTFVVNYEGENYLVENDTVYVREGGDMVEADETKQAVELGFNVEGNTDLATPNGDRIEVSAREQEFLATVEALLFPDDYLNADLVGGIEQAKAESFTDGIEDIASTASVSGFTDSKTGNYHGHGFDKHRAIDEAAVGTLDASLGMTEEAIDKLYFNDYDHAAPHELLARRDEFENAPFDIFEDDGVENDDFNHWKAIERAKSSAPINDQHHRQIRSMFSDDNQTGLGEF